MADVLQGRVPAKTIDTGQGTRFFGIAEISGQEPRSLEAGTDLSRAVYLQTGDIVIALLGDLGKSAMIDDRAAGAVLGRECAALRITQNERLLPSWLHAWTESQDFRQQIARHASGTTMPRVSTRTLADLVLPLPSLSCQQELAAKIGQFDAVLKTTEEMVRNLQELRAAEVNLAIAGARGE